MSALDFERRLSQANETLRHQKEVVSSLENEKAEALAQGRADKAVSANKKLVLAREEVVDLEITVKACEAKLGQYERNEPKAEKVREEIASVWSQLCEVAASMAAARETLYQGLEKASGLQGQINMLRKQHLLLVGEDVHAPGWPAIELYRRAMTLLTEEVLGAPLDPWKYVSRAEEDATRVMVDAERKEAQEARVRIAIDKAPLCSECKKPMTLRRYVGADGEDHRGCGTWSYEHCLKLTSAYIPETDMRHQQPAGKER
jgi:hypothetical protein